MTNVRDETVAWFTGRIPSEWFKSKPEISADRDEVVVVGELPDVKLEAGATEQELGAAREGRIKQFREDTREQRMKIADDVTDKWGRQLSWGVKIAGEITMFTHLSVPVMTRLRLEHRLTLDTLVDAGVARTRSDALAWCVRLVAKNQDAWLRDLREAFNHVEKIRAKGPAA